LDALAKLAFGIGKDPGGAHLIKRFCVPDHRGRFADPPEHGVTGLARYCARDVALLAGVWKHYRLGDPHPDDPVLELDDEINERGWGVDAEYLTRVSDAESRIVNELVSACGVPREVLSSDQQFTKWLKSQGVETPDVQAPTLEKIGGQETQAAIEARLALRNVVRAKCEAIRDTVHEARCRGTLVYYGAHTGRWSGRGPQPQNWPRASEDASEDPESATTITELRPHLRRCVHSPRGLVACDLSQIEARALLWFAGDEAGLQMYRDGDDPYVSVAASIYGTESDAVTPAQRNTGKHASLGCGYGGGVKALQNTVRKFRATLDLPAIDVVEGYRDRYPLVAGTRTGFAYWPDEDDSWGPDPVEERRGGLWRDLESAFCAVASERTARHDVAGGRAQYRRVEGGVELVLPSGRTMLYRDVRQEPDEEGRTKWVYEHPRGKRTIWKGALCENAIQATCRDLLALAMLRLRDAGYTIVLHVHDEVIVEAPASEADRICDLMTELPPWASGLPVSASATTGRRWMK
jgi:DNA polymerase